MSRPKGLDRESSAGLFYVWLCAFMFAGVVVLAFTLSVNARPAETWTSPVCLTPKFIKTYSPARKLAPLVVERRGLVAKAIIHNLNQQKPVTSYRGDFVMFWTKPGRPIFQTVIFKNGCAVVVCIFNRGCTTIDDMIEQQRQKKLTSA